MYANRHTNAQAHNHSGFKTHFTLINTAPKCSVSLTALAVVNLFQLFLKHLGRVGWQVKEQ